MTFPLAVHGLIPTADALFDDRLESLKGELRWQGPRRRCWRSTRSVTVPGVGQVGAEELGLVRRPPGRGQETSRKRGLLRPEILSGVSVDVGTSVDPLMLKAHHLLLGEP